MFKIILTEEFEHWLQEQMPKTRSLVRSRLDLLSLGHFGDCKRFEGLLELRWKNGIRVYCFFWDRSVVVALDGGNKNGQSRDIKKAKKIREEILAGVRAFHE
ncbi:MAG: type II toxin-antitoxin system RelE/ParE family toxin [Bdellovibrionaceae bacterium]|nr:type II toxin-antitoxin system RelE/ParE family toxin [Pseudobdellovibrionaceae bacterium]